MQNTLNPNDSKVIELIAQALNPLVYTGEEIKQNQKIIKEYKEKEGYIQILFIIVTNSVKKYSKEICLNAAIQIKNYINNKYTNNSINENDVNFIRENILKITYEAMNNNNDRKILKQFLLSQKLILRNDYINNKKFQSRFKADLIFFFESKDISLIYIGIVSFYQLSKIFETEYNEKNKKKYNETFDLFNQHFHMFIDNCVDYNNKLQNLILYKLIRIFYKTIHSTLPSSISKVENGNFQFWMKKIIDIANLTNSDITDNNPENKTLLTKMKKISILIFIRFYQKANSKFSMFESKTLNINKFFLENFSSTILDMLFNYLENNNKEDTYFLDDECICYIYNLLKHITDNRNKLKDNIYTFFKDKLHKEKLILDCLINVKDIEYWFNSHRLYIINQIGTNKLFDSHIKRLNVVTFLKNIITNEQPMYENVIPFLYQTLFINEQALEKEKTNYENYKFQMTKDDNDILKNSTTKDKLNKAINFANAELTFLSNNINNTMFHFRIKEALIYLLDNLFGVIRTNDIQLLQLFYQIIYPEINSNFGFMRERVCSFIYKYKLILFDFDTSLGIKEEDKKKYIFSVVQKLCNILEYEPYISVRIYAALSVPHFISLSFCKAIIAQNVKPLIQFYMKLVEEIDLDELINSIGVIIKELQNEIKEIILPLTSFIVEYIMSNFKKEEKVMNKTESSPDNTNSIQKNNNINTTNHINHSLNGINNDSNVPEADEIEEENEILYTSNIFLVVDSALKILLNIINYFIKDNEAYEKIEKVIVKPLLYILSPKGIGHLEECLTILIIILENRETISIEIWSLFKGILSSLFIGDENMSIVNFTEEVISVIVYYIIRDYRTLIHNEEYFNSLFVFFKDSTEFFSTMNSKLRNIYQVPIVLLETTEENIDPFLEQMLMYIQKNIEDNKFKCYLGLCELFCGCVIYSSNRNNLEKMIIPFLSTESGKKVIEIMFDKVIMEVYLEYESKQFSIALCILLYTFPNVFDKYFGKCVKAIFELANKNLSSKKNKMELKENDKENNDEENKKLKIDDYLDINANNDEEIFETLLNTNKEFENFGDTETEGVNIYGTENDKDGEEENEREGEKDSKNSVSGECPTEEYERDYDVYQELICMLKLTPIGKKNEIDIIMRTAEYLYANNPQFKDLIDNDKEINNLFQIMKTFIEQINNKKSKGEC